mmetsp:Transcript_85297/g.241703  ORF Transcript_85297/g.241703 Transcript_85297/m.241703 type:complete len:226 (+) Transcript_85297:1409-2086(+)
MEVPIHIFFPPDLSDIMVSQQGHVLVPEVVHERALGRRLQLPVHDLARVLDAGGLRGLAHARREAGLLLDVHAVDGHGRHPPPVAVLPPQRLRQGLAVHKVRRLVRQPDQGLRRLLALGRGQRGPELQHRRRLQLLEALRVAGQGHLALEAPREGVAWQDGVRQDGGPPAGHGEEQGVALRVGPHLALVVPGHGRLVADGSGCQLRERLAGNLARAPRVQVRVVW